MRGIVVFEEDDGILLFGHLKVFLCPVQPKDECFRARNQTAHVPVRVYGDVKVSLMAVRYVGPLVQGYELVCFAGVYHFNVGKPGFNILPEFQGNGQHHLLFGPGLPDRTGILSAMTGINDHGL